MSSCELFRTEGRRGRSMPKTHPAPFNDTSTTLNGFAHGHLMSSGVMPPLAVSSVATIHHRAWLNRTFSVKGRSDGRIILETSL